MRLSRLVLFGSLAVAFLLVGDSPAEDDWNEKLQRVFASVSAPKFPTHEVRVNVTAVENGDDVRQAVQAAIDQCHNDGGGQVYIPKGRWLIAGPLRLKSNVNLHLDRGCKLVFSSQPADFPLVQSRFEGTELMNFCPPIYANDEENVAITGEGTLDGGAGEGNWWAWKRAEQEDVRRLRQLAEDNVPVQQRVFGNGHKIRPNFVQFYKCRNVLIEGVTLINSPMWNIHPVLCKNVTVRGVTVNSHGPNNDGCNPESCRGVLIEDCVFDTGDDCIAIKSGRNADGRRLGVPSEDIVVRRCRMKDGHGGVVMGSEMSGGIRNVFVQDCEMDSPNLERAIRIKSNSLRGGIVENVYVRDVRVGEVSDAVLRINLEYSGESGEFPPKVRDIFLKNVTSKKSLRALYLIGLECNPIENVALVNCQFDGALKPSSIRHVNNIRLHNYGQEDAAK